MADNGLRSGLEVAVSNCLNKLPAILHYHKRTLFLPSPTNQLLNAVQKTLLGRSELAQVPPSGQASSRCQNLGYAYEENMGLAAHDAGRVMAVFRVEKEKKEGSPTRIPRRMSG